jgi:lysylphosphatidylglycerol synthetase-like protein (DUF2156 family)
MDSGSAIPLSANVEKSSWPSARIWLLVKLISGIVLTLFIVVLFIAATTGWFAYTSTNANDNTRYDAFFGQGFNMSSGALLFWSIFVVFIGILAYGWTRSKYFEYDWRVNVSKDNWKDDCVAVYTAWCAEQKKAWSWWGDDSTTKA